MDDFGVPLFSETSILIASHFTSCWGWLCLHLIYHQVTRSGGAAGAIGIPDPRLCVDLLGALKNKSRGFPQSWKGGKDVRGD